MSIIIAQIVGVLVFLISTIVVGIKIRRNPSKKTAEELSRISHLLFWLGLIVPEVVAIFYPGLGALDELVGLTPIVNNGFIYFSGWLMVVLGIYLMAASNVVLKNIGAGYAAFKLTQKIVSVNVYNWSRNPMSLGYYFLYLGISLLAQSSYLLVGTFFIIAVHLFNLLYFEQYELRLRYGKSYQDYSQKTAFIIPFFKKHSP